MKDDRAKKIAEDSRVDCPLTKAEYRVVLHHSTRHLAEHNKELIEKLVTKHGLKYDPDTKSVYLNVVMRCREPITSARTGLFLGNVNSRFIETFTAAMNEISEEDNG